MFKKRKRENNKIFQNSAAVEVIVKDLKSHPLCLHGSTLLFSSEKNRYFACSMCRDRKDCTVHIVEEDWHKENFKKQNEKYNSLIPNIDKLEAWNKFCKVGNNIIQKFLVTEIHSYCINLFFR
jgi:hypothetical protein